MARGLAVVQQAIFTSARSGRSADYRILAASPGIVEFDRRELDAWGPSHDALLDAGPEAASVNFFPLPSGSFCVSRTTPLDGEGSCHRLYTHCLIASPEALRQFANHPFLLLGAALAASGLQIPGAMPARLEPLELPETATPGIEARRASMPADAGLLAQLSVEVGAAPLAMFVQAALTNVCLAVRGPVAAARLIRGLLDCLPVDCRTSISFSTGLKFSMRRPFDLCALPHDAGRQTWLAQRPGATALDLGATRLRLNSWSTIGRGWSTTCSCRETSPSWPKSWPGRGPS